MVSCQEYCGLLEGAKIREDSWLEEVSKLLQEELKKGHSIAWAAYHVNSQQQEIADPSVIHSFVAAFL